MKYLRQIYIIILASSILGMFRLYFINDDEFTLIKQERILETVNALNLPDILTEPKMIDTDSAYLLYTTSQEIIEKFQSGNLYLTAIFVIFGIMRYLQITLVEKHSGSPTEIVLKDKIMIINIFLWILSLVWIIYLTPTNLIY